MSFSNYGELKTFIGSLATRSDLASQIPDFIASAEDMISTDVRAQDMIATKVIGESDRSSGAVYTLPADFLGARVLWGVKSGRDYKLSMVGPAELREYKSSVPPFFATTYGFNLEFRGTPETDSDFDLIYFARPTAMSADEDAPLLLTNHPNLYIHASMFWLHMKTQDIELAKTHRDQFDVTVRTVNDLAAKQRGPSRTRPSNNLGNRHRSAM